MFQGNPHFWSWQTPKASPSVGLVGTRKSFPWCQAPELVDLGEGLCLYAWQGQQGPEHGEKAVPVYLPSWSQPHRPGRDFATHVPLPEQCELTKAKAQGGAGAAGIGRQFVFSRSLWILDYSVPRGGINISAVCFMRLLQCQAVFPSNPISQLTTLAGRVSGPLT